MSEKITCSICGEMVHSVQLHLRDAHPEITLEDYRKSYPDAPIMSNLAKQRLEQKLKERKEESLVTEMSGAAATVTVLNTAMRKPMHEVFNLGKVKAAMNARGEPIPIAVLPSTEYDDMIPDKDPGYIFNIDLLKTTLLGLELKIPVYLWGHAGVGKSTLVEQVCAHTGRPYMRIQHTINTEESHIVGQTLANESGTYFEPGPLTLAMKNGWVYNADEYDYAHASVLSVYQAVLEGKPLVIKEAPAEFRVVHPHENFRFMATGNTNGAGDETGLYSGTNVGNAANYSRFGIVEKVEYMPKSQETLVIVNQAGVAKEDAQKLVEFAGLIRSSYEASKMGATVGPRELIYAGMIGLRRGSWITGLQLAFINRLGKVDRETAMGLAQRTFG